MISNRTEILLIANHAAFRSILSTILQAEGYLVFTATNAREGISMATAHAYDLIVLDIMLPDSNGLNVCRDIRHAGVATPILVLTPKTDKTDLLLGFKLGADNYVTPPFNLPELLARIEAMSRRGRLRSSQSAHRATAITLDVRHAAVTLDGQPVLMTAREFRLLHYLAKRFGTCVSRKELLKGVWGYAVSSTTRTIDVHIASLRQKLEVNPKSPKMILTVPKVGYKFLGRVLDTDVQGPISDRS